MKTIPDVFIIESLNPGDEGNGRFEGSVVSHTLRLHNKRPIYKYVRTRKQFEKAVLRFGESNYRYLHISAHANSEGMCTTNQDEIDYRRFAKIVAPQMNRKRLFLSACSMAKEKLAKKIIPHSECYSVVGPRRKISFSTASVFWPTLYHLMFMEKKTAMSHKVLHTNLSRISELYGVKINCFQKSTKSREMKHRQF